MLGLGGAWCAEREKGHGEQNVSEVKKFVFLCEKREERVDLQRELERRPTGDEEGKR